MKAILDTWIYKQVRRRQAEFTQYKQVRRQDAVHSFLEKQSIHSILFS